MSFPDHFSHPCLFQHSAHLYFNRAILALTVTFIKDIQQRTYWCHEDASGEALIMASTTIVVDWARWARRERELFAEWDLHCDWIRG